MAKKMSDEEMLEAMEQAVKMHFMAFQQFMKQTGGDIGLSLQPEPERRSVRNDR